MRKRTKIWAEEGIMRLEPAEEPAAAQGRKRGRRAPETTEGGNMDFSRRQSIEELSNNRIRKQ